jgi:predicted membrane protein
MGKKKTAALALYILGVLVFFSMLIQGVLRYPLSTLFSLLLMVPYVYVQAKEGYIEGKSQTTNDSGVE